MKTIKLTDDQFETLFHFVDEKVEDIVDRSVQFQDSEILEDWEDLFDVHDSIGINGKKKSVTLLDRFIMKNTHLEHPEDSILSGDLTVLDWFTSIDNDISAKIDGKTLLLCGELNQKLVNSLLELNQYSIRN